MHSRKIKRPKRSHKLNMSDDNEDDKEVGIRAPIVGYEVVDRREKFTVYKVHVRDSGKTWFVFRRYTDFVRLNDKLQDSFPGFHFKLPAKRWFKNNFDPDFIEERARGLQFFINNIMRHATISKSQLVKEFLCLDDPPGPFDSLEESRAYCQQLEDEVEDMKEKMMELQSELNATKSQLAQARVQQEALVLTLKEERASNSLTKETASDSGTFKSLSNSESTGDELWTDRLNIAAHSRNVDKVKPIARHKILTSTPDKSGKTSPTDENLLTLTTNEEQDDMNTILVDDIDKTLSHSIANTQDSEDVKDMLNAQQLTDIDDELTEIDSAGFENNKSIQSSKRDSGIVADNGLSPVNTGP